MSCNVITTSTDYLLADWYKNNPKYLSEREILFKFIQNTSSSELQFKKILFHINHFLLYYDRCTDCIVDNQGNGCILNCCDGHLVLPDIFYLRIYKEISLNHPDLKNVMIEFFKSLSNAQYNMYKYESLSFLKLPITYKIDEMKFYLKLYDFILKNKLPESNSESGVFQQYLISLKCYLEIGIDDPTIYLIRKLHREWIEYGYHVENVKTFTQFINFLSMLVYPMRAILDSSIKYLAEITGTIKSAHDNLKYIKQLYIQLSFSISFEHEVELAIQNTFRMIENVAMLQDDESNNISLSCYASLLTNLDQAAFKAWKLMKQRNE